MLKLFKKLFSAEETQKEVADIQRILKQIKEKENKENIALGRRIHSFCYLIYQICLDRDITENYRITVYQGQDRIYSFTIFAGQGKYSILELGYKEVITFLDGDRKVADLPDDDILKGFFYGH